MAVPWLIPLLCSPLLPLLVFFRRKITKAKHKLQQTQFPTNTNPNSRHQIPRRIKSQLAISPNPNMAAPGHQPSLLDGIDFSRAHSLSANPQLRTQAINRFLHVVEHFEAGEPTRYNNDYNRPALVRLTFQYARSPESQNKFLLAFFQWLLLGMADGDGDIKLDDDLRSLLFAFAEDLLYHLFVPCKISIFCFLVSVSGAFWCFLSCFWSNSFTVLAAGNQHTPQITPLSHAAIQNAQTQAERDHMAFRGTPSRPTTLRSTCLVRDRHRCTITRLFQIEEGRARLKKQKPPQDDDGNRLYPDDELDVLEVAHILPHSLTKQKDGQLV
ncbi:hypothetical protein B0T25DRAFT_57356 [Lasiosphaeria hispida]|uniref:HNH nuclease domain-containing protein n=1 Tax=Lasiosphaeria hispida TaxID=260671 RepID=A0AAJ0HWL0_9PEZI|nr:hypothetical protein B0T25DRAFT_57356 [Lasiosphaeria hispida]